MAFNYAVNRYLDSVRETLSENKKNSFMERMLSTGTFLLPEPFDTVRMSVLMMACCVRRLDIVRWCIHKGSVLHDSYRCYGNIDGYPYNVVTPLTFAIVMHDFELFEILEAAIKKTMYSLECNVPNDLCKERFFPMTPFTLSAIHSNDKVFGKFVEKYVYWDHDLRNKPEWKSLLLKAHLEYRVETKQDCSVTNVASKLIELGADIIKDTTRWGESVFQYIVENGLADYFFYKPIHDAFVKRGEYRHYLRLVSYGLSQRQGNFESMFRIVRWFLEDLNANYAKTDILFGLFQYFESDDKKWHSMFDLMKKRPEFSTVITFDRLDTLVKDKLWRSIHWLFLNTDVVSKFGQESNCHEQSLLESLYGRFSQRHYLENEREVDDDEITTACLLFLHGVPMNIDINSFSSRPLANEQSLYGPMFTSANQDDVDNWYRTYCSGTSCLLRKFAFEAFSFGRFKCRAILSDFFVCLNLCLNNRIQFKKVRRRSQHLLPAELVNVIFNFFV